MLTRSNWGQNSHCTIAYYCYYV